MNYDTNFSSSPNGRVDQQNVLLAVCCNFPAQQTGQRCRLDTKRKNGRNSRREIVRVMNLGGKKMKFFQDGISSTRTQNNVRMHGRAQGQGEQDAL